MQNAEDTVKRALDLVEKEPEIFETYEKYIDNVNPIFDDFLSLLQTT